MSAMYVWSRLPLSIGAENLTALGCATDVEFATVVDKVRSAPVFLGLRNSRARGSISVDFTPAKSARKRFYPICCLETSRRRGDDPAPEL